HISSYACELWERKLQLKGLHRRTRERAVGIGDDRGERVGDIVRKRGNLVPSHAVRGWTQNVQIVRAAEIQVRPFLPNVLHAEQSAPTHFAFDAETPGLLVGSSGGGAGAERANSPKAHVSHQAEGTSSWLNQSIRERIVQVQVGRRSVILVGGDHVGVL